jgi:prepilin-type N-terminal cleavage/methylation domain-containing protein
VGCHLCRQVSSAASSISGIRASNGPKDTVLPVQTDSQNGLLPRPAPTSQRSRHGFSMLEIATTLLLLSLLAAVTWGASQALRSSGSAATAVPLLTSAQVEARRLSDPDGTFPSDVVAQLADLTGDGLTFTAQNASDLMDVSVYLSDDASLVLAAVAGADCLVLVDRVTASSTWAMVLDAAENCSAPLLAAAVAALPDAGTPAAPQRIEQ